ncbi:hypothetical protein CLOBOL_07069 [Enterocloster bolteae ATCC BAA-613]|uniref:Uncharacterized protein n=1 Tax=Enterocloster bolteae (strain ATCC BAA-613 / DSM 15670 / CCUG 46953 / JCM 12243 / WAL 16351) TaxID=411902 RepID=A8S4T4_ENTBW|nr:hypothetical protein CLOBOL_07069 [Enterocloster bolteae ATCC BAA-613]
MYKKPTLYKNCTMYMTPKFVYIWVLQCSEKNGIVIAAIWL